MAEEKESKPTTTEEKHNKTANLLVKNWVVKSLTVNDKQEATVDALNTKLKVEVNISEHSMRVFFPGSLVLTDLKDTQESKGSRLATDMDMKKTCDHVLHSIDFSTNLDALNSVQKRGDTTLSIQSDNGNTVMLIQLASKWSLNDLFQTIQKFKQV